MIQVLSFTALLLATPAQANDLELPVLSPRASVTQQVGVVDITVEYSSPATRERTIWGELVPYGELWRTGANAATTLETTGDLTIDGTDVPAGRYALFSIPGEESWTVILNQNPDQSGTRQYDESLDQVRVEVKPEEGPARERMTFLFSDTEEDRTELQLEWAGVRVGLPIEVDTHDTVVAAIDAYASHASGRLARAASYRADNGDLEGALELVDAAIAVEETWYNTWLKASFLHEQGERKQARRLAKTAHELGTASDNFFYKDQVEAALEEW